MSGYNPYGYGSKQAGTSRYRQPLFARQNEQLQVQVDHQEIDIDREIEGLRGHVTKLKYMGQAIHEESQLQNALIASLEEGFEKAKLALSSARRRLDQAMVQVKGNHMLTLVLFALLMVLAVWIFRKILWWL